MKVVILKQMVQEIVINVQLDTIEIKEIMQKFVQLHVIQDIFLIE